MLTNYQMFIILACVFLALCVVTSGWQSLAFGYWTVILYFSADSSRNK